MAVTKAQAKKITALTISALKHLLELGLTYRLNTHLLDKHVSNWRETEFDLHYDYPVRGLGVIAKPDNIESGEFLHDDELVQPEEIVSYVGRLPLDAAMASYAFTIMEVYGDDVVKIVNPSFVQKYKAWHRGVIGDISRIPNSAPKALASFAEPFAVDYLRIRPASVIRLVAIKEARNAFAHTGNAEISFERFLHFVLAVVCQIHFACLPDTPELKVWPWSRLDDKWAR